MSEEKAKYRVLRLSHIHNQLWEEGAEVEYNGEPGSALEPLNDAAKAAKEKANGKTETIKPAPTGGNGSGDEVDPDLADLQEQYEQLFEKKPHPAMKADTIREKIAEKRKELGL